MNAESKRSERREKEGKSRTLNGQVWVTIEAQGKPSRSVGGWGVEGEEDGAEPNAI